MWAEVYFALLLLHHGSLCTQPATPSVSDRHTESCQGNELQSGDSAVAVHRSDAVLMKANAAFERAASLSEKQTAKNLLAAAETYRASAELFRAAGSDGQVAEA